MKKTLVGLTGAAGSGKDTAGKYLAELLGVETYALAAPIKAIVNTLFGWDERHSEGELKERLVEAEVPNTEASIFTILLINTHLEGICTERAKAIVSFFDLIDSELASADGVTSPRQMYQIVGTEWGRSVDEQLWLKIAEQKLETSEGLIITDVRFPNEATFVHERKGCMMKIVREDVKAVSTHSSEDGLPDIDMNFIVHNEGSISEMEEYIEAGLAGAMRCAN